MTSRYSPSSAAAALNVTPAAIRRYTGLYADYLSNEARSTPRSFGPADMAVMAYVVNRTATGHTHAQIQADLAAGQGLDLGAEWAPEPTTADDGVESGKLVPVAQYDAVRIMLEDSQRRERDAQDRLVAQDEQLQTMARELGRLEGEVAAARRDADELAERRRRESDELETMRQLDAQRRRSWWARLWEGGR